jgi:hypothetical protein
MSDGLREVLEAAWDETAQSPIAQWGMDDECDVYERHIRPWHEREVASLKAEVARLREIARKAMEHRVADQPAARGVRFDAALREIAGEGKP